MRRQPTADTVRRRRDAMSSVPTVSMPQTVAWEGGELYLLNQTLLPAEVIVERQESRDQVFEAIRQLRVRGAPAIGVAAAYGLCVAVRPYRDRPLGEFRS